MAGDRLRWLTSVSAQQRRSIFRVGDRPGRTSASPSPTSRGERRADALAGGLRDRRGRPERRRSPTSPAARRIARPELHARACMFDTSESMIDDIELSRTAAIRFLNRSARRQGPHARRLRHRGPRRALQPGRLSAGWWSASGRARATGGPRCTTPSASTWTARPRTRPDDSRGLHRRRRLAQHASSSATSSTMVRASQRHHLRRRLPREPVAAARGEQRSDWRESPKNPAARRSSRIR